MDSPEKTLLFFYGSLKRGYSNHHRVAGQEYLGEVRTEPGYRIIELGEYGGLIRDDRCPVAVTGELWAVDARCLAELDAFETGEGLWARRLVAITGRSGVQSYCWTGDVPDGVRSGAMWPFTSDPSFI
jgi:gamma-glutamylaminecyclotransferase